MIATDDFEWFLVEGINPEPWAAPGLSTGRRGGKVFPMAYKNPGVAAYQEAVKESLNYDYPHVELWEGQIELEIFFWRVLPTYAGDNKTVTKNWADATNMQKALEDSLQGILLDNDRNVVSIHSHIVEQDHDTDPAILIGRRIPDSDFSSASDRRRSIGMDRSRHNHPSRGHEKLQEDTGYEAFDEDFEPKSIF